MTQQMVPSKREMEAYLADGLTQQQIVEAWEAKSQVRVSRSAIGMAIKRYGLESSRPRPRYEDMLPWRVKPEHAMALDARMLRLEGRRAVGRKLSTTEARQLREWKQLLLDRDAVVTYEPDTEQGWWWVQRDQDDHELIRRPRRRRKAG